VNVQRANANDSGLPASRSRGEVPPIGLCNRCIDGCEGNCDVFRATFRGPEVIRRRPLSHIGIEVVKNYPPDYSHLCILGDTSAAALSAESPPVSKTRVFAAVDVHTEYGWDRKVKMSAPVFTGALGPTEIVRKYWEHFAVGAAISGVAIVCGEDVCGGDPQLQLGPGGKIRSAPDLDRRLETYRRYYRGLGEILVQMNAEDARLGLAEYLLDEHGLDTIELPWARCLHGDASQIKASTLEQAQQWKKRGYVVMPDPSDPVIQSAFHHGAIQQFERHSRLGFLDEEGFLAECDRLRRLGFQRITLKTIAHSPSELALALRWGSEAKIDLLTIDGAPGAAGTSPCRIMDRRGMPTLDLQAAAVECSRRLAAKGGRVPDLAFAGDFSTEDQIFKTLALGSPLVKAVCMDRALLIPGLVGKNLAHWTNNGRLPETVSVYGQTPEQIFLCWEEVARIVGRDEMGRIPLGALGVYCYVQKLSTGLGQLMAGARCPTLSAISRRQLTSLSRECAELTGVPSVTDAASEEAEAVLER